MSGEDMTGLRAGSDVRFGLSGSVTQLAALLKSKNGCGTKYQLSPPWRLGFWLRYRIDTVQALDQQFQP